MEQLVSEASAERRFQTLVLTVFGGISLFLSLLGLYALMAYSVQRRTAESASAWLWARNGALYWARAAARGDFVAGRNCAGFFLRVGSDAVDRQPAFRSQPTDPLYVCGSGGAVLRRCGDCVLSSRRGARRGWTR